MPAAITTVAPLDELVIVDEHAVAGVFVGDDPFHGVAMLYQYSKFQDMVLDGGQQSIGLGDDVAGMDQGADDLAAEGGVTSSQFITIDEFGVEPVAAEHFRIHRGRFAGLLFAEDLE